MRKRKLKMHMTTSGTLFAVRCTSTVSGEGGGRIGNVFSAMSDAMMVMLSQSVSDDMLSMLTQLMTSLIDSDSNAIMSRTIMS